MALEYIATGENPADLLKQSMPHTQLTVKRSLCGLV